MKRERESEREHVEKGREKKQMEGREKEMREHGVDRALNSGPTGVLRRSTELVGISLVPSLLSWFTALLNPTPSLRPLFCTASSTLPFSSFCVVSSRQHGENKFDHKSKFLLSRN